MENDNTVLLNPPLFALDKDAPLHYAGNTKNSNTPHEWEVGGKEGSNSHKNVTYSFNFPAHAQEVDAVEKIK